MSNRVLIWLVFATLVGVVAFPLLIPDELLRRANFEAARAESFQALAGAATPAELRTVVGDRGVFFVIRDRHWIAIRYKDIHGGPGSWSSAVARDSGGGWFVCEVHFCGRFESYRFRKERGEDIPDDVRAIEEAKDLETARQLLIGLGFRRVDAPD